VEREFAALAIPCARSGHYRDMTPPLARRSSTERIRRGVKCRSRPGWAKAVAAARMSRAHAGVEILRRHPTNRWSGPRRAMKRLSQGEAAGRHALLRKNDGPWRNGRIRKPRRVNTSVTSVIERALVILIAHAGLRGDRGARGPPLSVLSSSSLVHFFVSMLVSRWRPPALRSLHADRATDGGDGGRHELIRPVPHG